MLGIYSRSRGKMYVLVKNGSFQRIHLSAGEVRLLYILFCLETGFSGDVLVKDMYMSNDGVRRVVPRYEDGVSEASKPIVERQACFAARGGKMKAPRRHHLTPSKQVALLQQIENEGRFVSPFTRYGAYDGVVESLVRLGENESHLFGDVVEEIEKYLSEEASRGKSQRTAWEKFRDRRPRSETSAKDCPGRIMQNILVLQRIGGADPYALKLSQLGACIDVLKSPEGAPFIRLRTGIASGGHVVPINEMKKRKCPRPSGVDYLISRKVFQDGVAKSDVLAESKEDIHESVQDVSGPSGQDIELQDRASVSSVDSSS